MKVNPWAFGLLFLRLSGIWMWSNFELPKFYPFEKTGKTIGYVFYSKKVQPKLRYKNFDQIVRFFYEVDGFIHVSEHRAYKGGQYQNFGDSLLVVYSVNNPERTKPLIYYKNKNIDVNATRIGKSFIHIKSDGYKTLDIVGRIFTYEDYDAYGKRVVKTTGIYLLKENKIKLIPKVYYQKKNVPGKEIEEPKPIRFNKERIVLSDFTINPDHSLLEVNTNLVFSICK